MLVYMLLNVVEERAYIGQTNMTFGDRLNLHKESAKGGSDAPLHVAMRRWPDDWTWTYVILQNCYTQDELDKAEEAWIAYCCTADTGVGYNVHRTCHRGGTQQPKERKRAPITDEQREFYRQCGMKGAAHGRKGTKPKAEMSEEDREKYREWGRKGAEKSRRLRASK